MKQITIKADVSVCRYDELQEEARTLTATAKEATDNSYSPYSGFRVGAAVRLVDRQHYPFRIVGYVSGQESCRSFSDAFHLQTRF